MAKKIKKLPTDTNKKAKAIVDALTSEDKDTPLSQEDLIKLALSELGKLGGKKGGPARAAALTQKRRTEIAKKAAAARWGTKEN